MSVTLRARKTALGPDVVPHLASTGTLAGRPDRVSIARVVSRSLPCVTVLVGMASFFSVGAIWRGPLLLGVAVVLWGLNALPDFVVGLGLVVAWNLLGIGRPEASLSGFASPTWFLLIAILGLAASLAASGLLERLAIRLMLVFPATFVGQTVALLVGGLLITPMLPLTVARCAMTAPLAVSLARTLHYRSGSSPAVGIGLAAFVGSGLLSRGFLSGATLNFIAWGLLPADARPSWMFWALAAAPVTLLTASGSLGLILAVFRPVNDSPLPNEALIERLRAKGPISRAEHLAGAATLTVLAGFILGPLAGINGTWIAGAGFLVLLGLGVLERDQVRTALDWPLLLFLGVTLSLPGMVHDLGLDTTMVSLVPRVLPAAHASPMWSIAVLFALTLATRVVLSEWVAVPLLTVTLLPAASALDLHPWVIAFVVLLGSNLWTLPYQYASYVAFAGGAAGALWTHRQVLPFSVVHIGLSLLGLLISTPWWRLLGLVK